MIYHFGIITNKYKYIYIYFTTVENNKFNIVFLILNKVGLLLLL